MVQPIVSVTEARKLLGDSAEGMSDTEILEVINTLDLLAKEALQEAKHKLARKRDAKVIAEVIYDVYKEEKNKNSEKV
jgi:hypothetical protein